MRTFRTMARGAVLAAGLLLAGGALAADIEIKAPWSRATAKGATVGAGYLTIVNKGSAPDRLVSASADVAEKAEVHEMAMDNGAMTMRAMSDGLDIKPGESVTLKPGGLHLMLTGLKQPLVQGGVIHVTLTFAKAGPITAALPIGVLGATGPAPAEDAPTINY